MSEKCVQFISGLNMSIDTCFPCKLLHCRICHSVYITAFFSTTGLLLENVFKQLTTEALSVSRNQTVSTIVESLLHHASPSQLQDFTAALAEDWETACQDRFASHVVQTLLLCVAPHFCDQGQGTDSLLQHFLNLLHMLLSNLAVFMQDVYASHIVRVVMEVLAGHRVAQEVIKSKLVRRQQKGKWW